MHCDELSFQELLDCLANGFNYDTENNTWNVEHNTETMQRVTTTIYLTTTEGYHTQACYEHKACYYVCVCMCVCQLLFIQACVSCCYVLSVGVQLVAKVI